jgi:hypothetical protein
MKLAVIAPPGSMRLIRDQGYNFALGQELCREVRYLRWHEVAAYEGRFIIVDNGAAEPEDERLPFEEIVYQSLGLADEIILPDKLRDSKWTLEHSLDGAVLNLVPARKRFVVPQGKNWDEWKECLHLMFTVAIPATIGVAKWIEGGLPGGRPQALKYIMEAGYHHHCNIHLLGIYEKPREEVTEAAAVLPSIRGVDTGAPIAYAQNDVPITDDAHYSLDWGGVADMAIAAGNISSFRKHCWSPL